MEKELNREKIIKALECCTVGIGAECEKCPYMLTAFCNDTLNKDVLLYINKLTEENKKCSEKIVQLISQVDCDKAEIKLLRKHIESLGTTIEMQEQEVHSIKADTVRKMQEVLCEGRVSNDPVVIAVNVAAKEMLEGGDVS